MLELRKGMLPSKRNKVMKHWRSVRFLLLTEHEATWDARYSRAEYQANHNIRWPTMRFHTALPISMQVCLMNTG